MPQPHYFSPQSTLFDAGFFKTPPTKMVVMGKPLQFLTGEGVFSRGALDEGSRILIEFISLAPGATFCDLGCGWGAVGAFVAHRNEGVKVFACDVNARAVQLARFNLQLNKVQGALTWCDDGLGATKPELFDCIACNPPIRAGNATIAKMFADAERGLKVGGELWVVIRTAQGAKSWQKRLEAQFGACETVHIRHGYRILKAVRSS